MYTYELQKATDILVKDVCAVKKGETVVLTGDSLSCMPVINAVASSVYAAGGLPMIITFRHRTELDRQQTPNFQLNRLLLQYLTVMFGLNLIKNGCCIQRRIKEQ